MTRTSRRITSILHRSLSEHARALIGWLLGLGLFVVVMLALYPTVSGTHDFSKLLNAYPEALRKLFNLADYTSGPGYLRAEIFSITCPLLFAVFAIGWGADLIAGEEDRHTLDILLANPISRGRVVLEKWVSFVVGTAILSIWLLMLVGIGAMTVGLHVGWADLAVEVLALGLLALSLGTAALAIGSATGRKDLAIGITAGVAVASYLLSSLPELVSWLTPIRPLSPWYHALGVDPLTKGFQPLHLGILIATITGLVGISVASFNRRDLSA
jgi:ABC-2 type transport system permease protein